MFKQKHWTILFNILFICSNLVLLFYYYNNDFLVLLSFLPIFVLSQWMLTKVSLSNDKGYFELTFWFFTYLFLFTAPYIQSYYRIFPNTIPYDTNRIAITNLVILCFLIIFLIVDEIKKKKLITSHKDTTINKMIDYRTLNIKAFYISFIFSILILGFFIYMFKDINLQQSNLEQELIYSNNKILVLLVNKFLFNFPIFITIYLILNKYNFSKFTYRLLLTLSLIILLIIQNPLFLGRNQFAVTYLSIFIIFYYNKITNQKLLVLYLLSFILFPFIGVIVHSQSVFELTNESFLKIDLLEHFISLDYDAWSNIMATIIYVNEKGSTIFKQLIGTVLFFVPRNIWPSKPISTGELIGNYLIDNYSMWFNNLSNPFISEGYINFGITGVIFFAIILSRFKNIINKIKNNNYPIYVFTSIYLFFLLRGDLMSSFAYYIALLFAIYISPLLINSTLKILLKMKGKTLTKGDLL